MTSAIPVERSNQLNYQANWELVKCEFQLFKLKQLHCDDLHIILSLSAVQIYDYFIYSYLYRECQFSSYVVFAITFIGKLRNRSSGEAMVAFVS